MRMNVAQEADAVVESAKGLVNLRGPTTFKAHQLQRRELNLSTN